MRRMRNKLAKLFKWLLVMVQGSGPELLMLSGMVFILVALYNVHLNVGLIGTGIALIGLSFLASGG